MSLSIRSCAHHDLVKVLVWVETWLLHQEQAPAPLVPYHFNDDRNGEDFVILRQPMRERSAFV